MSSELPVLYARDVPSLLLLFNFVTDVIIDCTLTRLQNMSIMISAERSLVNPDYADDTVMLFDIFESARFVLNRLLDVIPSLDMQFAP